MKSILKNGSLRAVAAFATVVAMVFIASVLVSCDNDGNSVSASVIDVNDSILTRTVQSTEYCYVKQTYKNSYQHLKQLGGECSWTSYVLTTAAVARAKGEKYPMNKTNPVAQDYRSKITHVRTLCVDTAYIWKLDWYARTVDNPAYSSISPKIVVESVVVGDESGSFDRATFTFLRERRKNQAPCIFLASKYGVGHFYILWDLEWNGTAANSYVYYTDADTGSQTSLSSYNTRKNYMTLAEMLSLKLSSNHYNFLFFNE